MKDKILWRLVSLMLTSSFLLFLISCSPMIDALSQDQRDYDFHETSWGYTQAQVELSEIEQESIIALRTPDTLIYKCKLGDVQALRIYTFKNNRLRCAGYVTKHPVKGKIDNRFHKLSEEKHGTPTFSLNGGDVWIHGSSVIYAKSYTSYVRVVVPQSKYTTLCTSNGLFAIPDSGLPTQRSTHPNIINRWSSVWSYTDRDFHGEIQDAKFPSHELSLSEQVLFGLKEERLIFDLIPVF
ncbi:hypothetical protein F4083_00575 [Candidatus Poribacteria bacterium]|nr:hypothetical protein [Candidatus Poribacteria bacterium]MYI92814.1 hypothetical protein [Candidatus Poribacteria bacterium]